MMTSTIGYITSWIVTRNITNTNCSAASCDGTNVINTQTTIVVTDADCEKLGINIKYDGVFLTLNGTKKIWKCFYTTITIC